jgi:hypothetical protein
MKRDAAQGSRFVLVGDVHENKCAVVIGAEFAFFGGGAGLTQGAYGLTSINIQMTPIYIMKDLDLARKHGLDAEVLMIPVSSRAVQAALAGEIQFMTSGA